MSDWRARLRDELAARGRACDPDVVDELSTHVDAAWETWRSEGVGPEDAEQRLARLIDVWAAEAPDLTRAARTRPSGPPPPARAPWFVGLLQDVRYGFAMLRRQPGFAATAILIMGLGIGAATAIFTIANGVLLTPLPWTESERLVRATELRDGRTGRVAGTLSNGTFRAWSDRPQTIAALGGWLTQTATLTGAGDPTRVSLIPTTASLFPMLGAQPLIGRLFTDADGATGQPGAALLSYGLWQERFGARPDVLGQPLQLNGTAYTIVGVMPRSFAFPDGEARAWTAWQVPSVVQPSGALAAVIFRAIARLNPGATPDQAAAEATARARNAPDMGLAARALFGAAGPIEVRAAPELEAITAEVRPALFVMLVAAALLLATAVANVASLQLARAVARRREFALRAAIGAGQRRLARQLVVEHAIVGLAGAAVGLMLTTLLLRALPDVLPAGFPRQDAIAIDASVLGFALLASLLASLATALVPARVAGRLDLVDTLAAGDGAGIGAGPRAAGTRARGVIMAGQVAAACLLLVGATLLTRSLIALSAADRGYDPSNVLTARLPLPPAFPVERRGPMLDAIIARLEAVPGVTRAAYATGLPLLSAGAFAAFDMPSPLDPGVPIAVQATQRLISPGYVDALRLRVSAGRSLADTDRPASPPVVLVNRTFADRYLGGEGVGRRLPLRGARAGSLRFVEEAVDAEIVGIVDDTRQEGASDPPQPEIFASLRQILPTAVRGFDPIFVVRTSGDPTALVPTLRSLVAEQDPTLALDSVMSMDDRVSASLARPRLYAVVLVLFGSVALIIAATGLFAALSFSVSLRTREIGVRAALGADAPALIGLVLRHALWIVIPGLLVGLAASLAGARLLAAFLFGVGPYDPGSFVAVTVFVIAVAAVACLVPARRAASIDPVAALRGD